MPRKRKSFLYVSGKGSSRGSKPRMNYSKRGLDFIVRVYRIATATHERLHRREVSRQKLATGSLVGFGIEARKCAINLVADWRNIHEEQSFPGNFWSAEQEPRVTPNRFLSRQKSCSLLVIDADKPSSRSFQLSVFQLFEFESF